MATGTTKHVTLTQAQKAPLTPGDISALLHAHGRMTLEYYAPRGHDPQTPHTKDEIYIIATGRAGFIHDAIRVECTPGDALFVPAGVVHRFEDMSDDFGSWVIFYGPEGGE
jgi:mannose-6-phosphate isomerase-like protein (cupin superfamily)